MCTVIHVHVCSHKFKKNVYSHKFEKKWADVFQIYPNAIHLNPLQFCPSMPLLGLSCVLLEFFYSREPLFSYFSYFYDQNHRRC